VDRPRFAQEDLEFLSAFANQAAIAIDNATLRQRLADEALKRNTLVRFFPPTAIEAIMDAGGELAVTETPASVVFCDISGFTRLCSAMKPRQVIDLLNEYFPAVVAPVFAHEGTLEKYIGDALLAAWGAPIRHDDDADRAVSAALDMQRAVAGLNAQWTAVGRDIQLAVHIGVATGEVAAGNIGSPQYVQYATVGEVTNLASRICGVAQPHEVVIDEETRRRLRRRDLILEGLPPTRVKGHAEPLTLHRVRWRN
jgi:adenylate cyclase